MRGPGPKWHAKHTASLVAAAGVQPVIAADAPRAGFRRAQNTVLTWIGPSVAAAAVGFAAIMMLA